MMVLHSTIIRLHSERNREALGHQYICALSIYKRNFHTNNCELGVIGYGGQ